MFYTFLSVMVSQNVVSPQDIGQLEALFGPIGLVGGIGVLGITVFRKAAPAYWARWPRWARFALGFVSSSGPAVIVSLISGEAIGVAIGHGISVGLAWLGGVEAVKTAMKPSSNKNGES